ncbi:hypothetical protein DSO57_1003460 [Entomophthora muscae]|uniref:Uncharacterized protein n=1 Tax=Entomophthora muscae TaxID=34485 RepID=A0ACC2UTS7_9FUNG|nr:hypothetical protein DSO57_1003460 [Entomophthora muscae]
MLQEFHENNPQAVGPVKATLAAMKLPPAHKNYALAALPGGGKSLLPKKESNAMAIISRVWLGQSAATWETQPKALPACSDHRFKSNN